MIGFAADDRGSRLCWGRALNGVETAVYTFTSDTSKSKTVQAIEYDASITIEPPVK